VHFLRELRTGATSPNLPQLPGRAGAQAEEIDYDWESTGSAAMIVRTLVESTGTERDIRGDGWRSRRLLRRDDGVNFSLHITEIDAGTELELEYANHFEANYCIAGSGEVTEVTSGTVHRLDPGTMYTLDQHDRHILRVTSPMTLLCVFWPALVGDESHDATGGYPSVQDGPELIEPHT
jgi:L-ectoine synthase